MLKSLQIALILTTVISVALADVLLKKATVLHDWPLTLKSPWLLVALLLYVYQIFFFVYLFVTGGKLVLITSLQTVLYPLLMVAAGVFIFQEKLTGTQTVGVVLAIGGAVLITLE